MKSIDYKTTIFFITVLAFFMTCQHMVYKQSIKSIEARLNTIQLTTSRTYAKENPQFNIDKPIKVKRSLKYQTKEVNKCPNLQGSN